MAARFVCQSVCLSVYQIFSIHFLPFSYLFNTKTDQVHMWYAYVENIMQVGLLGSKVIKVVMVDETLR